MKAQYKYIGKSNFFVSHGDKLEGVLTTWSVKKPCSIEREKVDVLYVKNAGFNGEDMPINAKNLIEILL